MHVVQKYKPEGRADKAIFTELGSGVCGATAGRENDCETLYLNTVGRGIEDVALASKVVENAKRLKIGQHVNLWKKSFAM